MRYKISRLHKQVLLVAAATVIVYISLAANRDKAIPDGIIQRPDYLDTQDNVRIKAMVQGTDEEILKQMTVEPREYSADQIESIFTDICERLPEVIRGSNESIGKVSSSLNLVSGLEGYPVEIEWHSNNYELIDYDGNVHIDKLEDNETVKVGLEAVLEYGEYKCRRMYDVTVVRPVLSEEDQIREGVLKAVDAAEAGSRQDESIKLPDNVNGNKISYSYESDSVSPVVALLLGLVGIVTVVAGEKKQKVQQLEKRQAQLKYDYSEMVSKLTLLIGAGMTIRKAWFKIVQDYKTSAKEKRYVYEEMAETKKQLEAGMPENIVYESFGRRCNTKEYLKLGALLEQNTKKGAKIIGLLEQEAVEAFEEHKNMARKKGEEAGTKLLIPMIMMLVIVMIIVMVPAVMSFDI